MYRNARTDEVFRVGIRSSHMHTSPGCTVCILQENEHAKAQRAKGHAYTHSQLGSFPGTDSLQQLEATGNISTHTRRHHGRCNTDKHLSCSRSPCTPAQPCPEVHSCIGHGTALSDDLRARQGRLSLMSSYSTWPRPCLCWICGTRDTFVWMF